MMMGLPLSIGSIARGKRGYPLLADDMMTRSPLRSDGSHEEEVHANLYMVRDRCQNSGNSGKLSVLLGKATHWISIRFATQPTFAN